MSRVLTRFSTIPMNTFTPLVNSAAGGGLAVQVNGEGQFRLQDDQALVLTINPGKSSYFNIQVLDPWGAALDVRHRLTQLNNLQSHRISDGNYVFVISAQDPGIQNWLDVSGISEGFMYTRFQGFPTIETPTADSADFPRLQVALVRYADLIKLPGLGQRISPEQRKDQLHARAATYQRRLPAMREEK